MAAKKLRSDRNLAHEIANAAFDDHDVDEIVQMAKEMLDLALNHKGIDEWERAKIVGKICWRFGLEPPAEIMEWLV